MIKVDNITKRYGTKYAVKNVSFEVKEGEVVGFLGRNGAGKTTTMNILTGYISSSEGSASVDGHDILEDPHAVKKCIGYLPEQPPVYLDMTVDEYLSFCCQIKNISSAQRNNHIADVCHTMKITDMRKRLIKNLSKGYKQRVGFAQALIGNPKVLILDEPTVGLDPRQIIEIRNLITALGKQHTIILSSHILKEVEDVCERVIIIDQGQIVAQDTMANLAQSVGDISRLVIRIGGADKHMTKSLRDLEGVSFVEEIGIKEPDSMDFMIESVRKADVRRTIFNSMARAGKPILMMRPMDVSLEDIFMQLTTIDKEG
jgi:ABC-2 type transport system ATP-binding protein